MEYIIVRTTQGDRGRYKVLINGEENGMTGNTIGLGGSGYVSVSAAKNGSKEKIVLVENTTITHPMIIELE